jgi:16S rRNA processing protein RimM
MAGERSTGGENDRAGAVVAGRVGRAHGLDGSFYVTGPRPRLLALGAIVTVAGRSASVARRAGTDDRPIVRLDGVEDRGAAEALRGLELTVELAHAPQLSEDEWWAVELEGCQVVDGERQVGIVSRLIELPSCEALEVRLAPSSADAPSEGLLVPMVAQAIRHVDVAGRRIDVDMSFVDGD